MINKRNSKIDVIFSAAKELPCFTLDDLASIEKNKTYLKILFSRYTKVGKVIRLKKGVYVAKDYLDKIKMNGSLSFYLEMTANIICQPSYLSLEYVLYQNNLLTELPVNFTSVALTKTASFSNKFGNFFYHKVKKDLFCGFDIIKEGEFSVLKASKAKALFDFLYLRKNAIINKESAMALRLNLGEFKKEDIKELEKYVKIEGSKKMKEIFNYFNF